MRNHLSRIYRTLGLSTVLASVGAYIHLYDVIPFVQGGILSLIVSVASLIILSFGYPFIRGDSNRSLLRSNIFGLFSFSYGLSLGPFLESIINISNDSIIPTALLLTALIFISFSASAIFSQRRSFLFLGGILTSAISVLSVLGLLNLFIGSQFLFNVDIYVGLLVFSGFLLFDTQMIIERIELATNNQVASSNDDGYQYDTIQDSLQLFLDSVSIFIRLAMILSKNAADKNNNRENENKKHRRSDRHMRG